MIAPSDRSPHLRLALCLILSAVGCGGGDESGPGPVPGSIPTTVVVTGPEALVQGESAQFSATLLDQNGDTITGRSFAWYSQDSSVAYVSQHGLVTVKQPGTCIIYAAAKPVVGSALVRISDAAIATHLVVRGKPLSLAVSGNKGYIGQLYSDSTLILDFIGERLTGSIRTGQATAIAFDPAGLRAYFIAYDSVGVIDATADTLIAKVSVGPSLDALVTSADGQTIWVISGFYGRLYALSATTLTVIDSVAIPSSSRRLVLHPSLNRLYLNGIQDAVVREYDATTLDLLRTWNLGGRPSGMTFSLDGSRLFVANHQNWVDEVLLSSGAVSAPVPLPAGGADIVLSPDGARLALTSSSGAFLLYSSSRGLDRTVTTGGGPTGLAFRPDGNRLLVINVDSWLDFIR
jgi:DNA-binding beta-propeller fold protein YncE